MILNQSSNTNNQPPWCQKLRLAINVLIPTQTNVNNLSAYRIEQGQIKNQIKNILEQASTSNESAVVIEQFLAYCIKYQKLAVMLSILQDTLELTGIYAKPLQQISKKYLELSSLNSSASTGSSSKLQQKSAKSIRLLLAKRIIEDHSLLVVFINLSKNSMEVCCKLLNLIAEYYQEYYRLHRFPNEQNINWYIDQQYKVRKQSGNVTQLIVLCINILKLPQSHLPITLLKNSLVVLNTIMDSNTSIHKNIIELLFQQCLRLYQQRPDVWADGECLNTLNGYLRISADLKINVKQSEDRLKCVRIVAQVLANRVQAVRSAIYNNQNKNSDKSKQDVSKFSKISNQMEDQNQTKKLNLQKGSQKQRKEPFIKVQDQKTDKLTKQLENILRPQKSYVIKRRQSASIAQFLQTSMRLIKNFCQQKNNNNKQIQKLQKQLLEISKNIVAYLDCNSVSVIIGILQQARIQNIQVIYLQQVLTNCLQYTTPTPTQKPAQQNKFQNHILSVCSIWYNNLPIETKNTIRVLLNLQAIKTNTHFVITENALSLFVDFIKKSIENQFQFVFDEGIVASVGNLICYLGELFQGRLWGVVDQEKVATQNRNTILQLCKMLINLNQSCQKQYKPQLIKSTIKILAIYSREMMQNNQFLRQVLQDKLLQTQVMQMCRPQIYYLAMLNLNIGKSSSLGADNKGIRILDEQFYEGLLAYLESNQHCISHWQCRFLFDILVTSPKFKEIIEKHAIDHSYSNNSINTDSILTRWQWQAHAYCSGKALYNNQWNYPERQIRYIKDNKMAAYPIEFAEDIARLEICLSKK